MRGKLRPIKRDLLRRLRRNPGRTVPLPAAHSRGLWIEMLRGVLIITSGVPTCSSTWETAWTIMSTFTITVTRRSTRLSSYSRFAWTSIRFTPLYLLINHTVTTRAEGKVITRRALMGWIIRFLTALMAIMRALARPGRRGSTAQGSSGEWLNRIADLWWNKLKLTNVSCRCRLFGNIQIEIV